MAQGSQELTSSRAGAPGPPSVNEPTRCWANMIATTSAWSAALPSRSTQFTPTPTSAPETDSNTAAPNGPPVRRSTFSRESAMASPTRSASPA